MKKTIFKKIRIAGSIEFTCGNCGHENRGSINLSDIEAQVVAINCDKCKVDNYFE